MIDFKTLKSLKIPEGVVTKIVSAGVTLWEAVRYKNWVKFSTEADGKTIFNGGLGYKNNSRLNSSAAVVTLDGYTVTGYIPARAGDIVRAKGVSFDSAHNSGCYFWTFDSSFTKLKNERPTDTSTDDVSITQEENGVIAFYLASYNTSVRYIRFSAYGDGANAIVTVNEEIT